MSGEVEKQATVDVTVSNDQTVAIERIAIMPIGGSLNDEPVIRVGVDDEGAGSFVTVDRDDQRFEIDPDEWPALRDAIERMMMVARALG
jgi:hypothetical protein